MTFQEADAKLTAMVGADTYRTLDYELHHDNITIACAKCTIYVHPSMQVSGETWAEAFSKLEKILNPPAPSVLMGTEAPTEELGATTDEAKE
jgi:hypothetical protein